MFANKRLSKELLKMQDHIPPGISIGKSDNLEEWQMDIKVLDDNNPIYKGHTYRLKFTFSNKYPIEPPEVQFIELPSTSDTPRPIPMHPHIYSNGIICLDLLSSSGWSPVQTVESVCMSIQSMLTANSRNERPPVIASSWRIIVGAFEIFRSFMRMIMFDVVCVLNGI
ncbi:ubiquitin conjugating enzyme [Penicillium daleae]|uniref:Ubiquitin conjugating enzyme n=1 Tax=Penicillium daleae TaxID=63821 RepID=A0AAD6CCM9_9EURO|nr:ubiquitin conjugating enzyme [Penicillium daleae]KAJ5460376.1 ubiquitin conjugating enzyme [Penicillium daleae]